MSNNRKSIGGSIAGLSATQLAEHYAKCIKLSAENVSMLLWSYIYIYYYRYSVLGPVWAETRAQSGDWYGSGTLHLGQVLRGSLPLLSLLFRRSHFRHQVPLRPYICVCVCVCLYVYPYIHTHTLHCTYPDVSRKFLPKSSENGLGFTLLSQTK